MLRIEHAFSLVLSDGFASGAAAGCVLSSSYDPHRFILPTCKFPLAMPLIDLLRSSVSPSVYDSFVVDSSYIELASAYVCVFSVLRVVCVD